VQRIQHKKVEKSFSQELILCAFDHKSPEERNKIKVFTSVGFTSVIGLFFVAFAHFFGLRVSFSDLNSFVVS